MSSCYCYHCQSLVFAIDISANFLKIQKMDADMKCDICEHHYLTMLFLNVQRWAEKQYL